MPPLRCDHNSRQARRISSALHAKQITTEHGHRASLVGCSIQKNAQVLGAQIMLSTDGTATDVPLHTPSRAAAVPARALPTGAHAAAASRSAAPEAAPSAHVDAWRLHWQYIAYLFQGLPALAGQEAQAFAYRDRVQARVCW